MRILSTLTIFGFLAAAGISSAEELPNIAALEQTLQQSLLISLRGRRLSDLKVGLERDRVIEEIRSGVRNLQDEEPAEGSLPSISLPGGHTWQPTVEPRGCDELNSVCSVDSLKSLKATETEDKTCHVVSADCFEFVSADCGAAEEISMDNCSVDWVLVLQSIDRELFQRVQGILFGVFSLPPEQSKALMESITRSVSGEASYVEHSLSFFEPFMNLLPLVEEDLTVKFDMVAWESFKTSLQSQEAATPANRNSDEKSEESSGPSGILGQLSQVVQLPEGRSFNDFLSTIQWEKGLLENIGLDEESFAKIRDDLGETKMEELVSDLGLLVQNVKTIGDKFAEVSASA